MISLAKRLVLAAVLAVMPLQGTAATLAGLLCDPGAQMHGMHANDGHDRGASQDGDQDKGNTGGIPVWHPFHGAVFGTGVAALPAAAPDFSFRALAPDPSHDLPVLEQPQRPPLA